MTRRFIDLSHRIEAGMTTYKGLPAPAVCDYWTREQSAANYDDGSSFSIVRIEMVSNTGTYLDSPFHRYADGADLAELELSALADLEIVTVDRPFEAGLATDVEHLGDRDIGGRAVLVRTGWDRHWRTGAYFDNHPYVTAAAAEALVERGARLVGIDSHNIDDTRARTRPVHTILLGAGVLVCEHMTNLAALPPSGARLHAAPPKFAGVGTFPVQAFALIED
jgi:kynurenine formamidase